LLLRVNRAYIRFVIKCETSVLVLVLREKVLVLVLGTQVLVNSTGNNVVTTQLTVRTTVYLLLCRILLIFFVYMLDFLLFPVYEIVLAYLLQYFIKMF